MKKSDFVAWTTLIFRLLELADANLALPSGRVVHHTSELNSGKMSRFSFGTFRSDQAMFHPSSWVVTITSNLGKGNSPNVEVGSHRALSHAFCSKDAWCSVDLRKREMRVILAKGWNTHVALFGIVNIYIYIYIIYIIDWH